MKNVGTCDRIARLVVGVVLGWLALYKLEGTWQIVAGIFSVIVFLTGVFGYCLLYTLLGIDSMKCSCTVCGACKKEEQA